MSGQEPTVIEYKHGDDTVREHWQAGQLHREDGPARIITWADGTVTEEWYHHGTWYRSRKAREWGPGL